MSDQHIKTPRVDIVHDRVDSDKRLAGLARKALIQLTLLAIVTIVVILMWVFVPPDSSLGSRIIATALGALSIPYAYICERDKIRASIACLRWHAFYCCGCGYDLNYTSSCCPECGTQRPVACPICSLSEREMGSLLNIDVDGGNAIVRQHNEE